MQAQFITLLELYGLAVHLGGGEVQLVVETSECRSRNNRGMVQWLSQLAQLFRFRLLMLQCDTHSYLSESGESRKWNPGCVDALTACMQPKYLQLLPHKSNETSLTRLQASAPVI